jgi:hypothetical protein
LCWLWLWLRLQSVLLLRRLISTPRVSAQVRLAGIAPELRRRLCC